MIIKVTDIHIKTGIRFNSRECPIGQAVNELLNDKYDATIGHYHLIRIWHKDTTRMVAEIGVLNMSDITNRFVKFDVSGIMEPFEFEVDIPVEYLKTSLVA